MLRPKVMDKLKLDSFKMSTNYLFFWDKLEKSNTFLESMIELAAKPLGDRDVDLLLEDPCGDGGWWSYVVDLISKYGVVPSKSDAGNVGDVAHRRVQWNSQSQTAEGCLRVAGSSFIR